MSERTAEAATTVDEDGIRVEKSFTDDAFPVPAVMYELSSARDDPVRVRIVDRIPESFPMDRIGFHPEYESENWTAYKDHRVEFERVLDPGDAVETVFGIRDDDPELDGFLGTPVIEHVPVGEEIEDVLGTGDADAVREVLAGDRTTLPGMEDPATDAEEPVEAPAEAAEPDAPEPRAVVAGGTAAVTARDEEPEDAVAAAVDADGEASNASEKADAAEALEAADDADVTDEAEAADETDATDEIDAADEANLPDETPAEPTATTDDPAAADGESAATDEAAPAPKAAAEGGLAAALAAEIRADEVDDADLEVLREELDIGVPRSVDVRIARLQSSVADIEAYADALAEFIDGEGTAREMLDELDRKVETVESEMAALDDRVDAADADRSALRDTVEQVDDAVDDVSADVADVTERVDGVEGAVADVESTVGDVADDVSRIDEEADELGDAVDEVGADVETLYESVDDAAAAAEATRDRVEDVESRLGRFDEEFDDLWDDLAEVDTRLTAVEDRLGEDLDDVEAEIDAINEHLEELEAFRERLNEAFGP
jgi:predicted nuclease with TOPRIM domain